MFWDCNRLTKIKIPKGSQLLENIDLDGCPAEIIEYDPSEEIEKEDNVKNKTYNITEEEIEKSTKEISPEVKEKAKAQVEKDIKAQELTKEEKEEEEINGK